MSPASLFSPFSVCLSVYLHTWPWLASNSCDVVAEVTVIVQVCCFYYCTCTVCNEFEESLENPDYQLSWALAMSSSNAKAAAVSCGTVITQCIKVGNYWCMVHSWVWFITKSLLKDTSMNASPATKCPSLELKDRLRKKKNLFQSDTISESKLFGIFFSLSP